MREFKCYIDLSDINDSMELDSGLTIATLKGDKYDFELMTQGYVRVYYKDGVYTCASNMPKELLKIFHDGKITEDINVVENNWYELFIDESGGGFVCADLVDLDACSKEELEKFLNEEMDYYEKEYGTD